MVVVRATLGTAARPVFLHEDLLLCYNWAMGAIGEVSVSEEAKR